MARWKKFASELKQRTVTGVCLFYVKWEGKKKTPLCNYMFFAERCGHWHGERFQPKPHRQMLREVAFVASGNTQTGAACS